MKPPPELTAAAARRIYRVLSYLVHSEDEDGPDEQELALLERFRQALEIPPAEAVDIDKVRPETTKLKLVGEGDEKSFLIDCMIEIVAVDGTLDHEEQTRLYRLAEFLGLPRADLAQKLLERLAGL